QPPAAVPVTSRPVTNALIVMASVVMVLAMAYSLTGTIPFPTRSGSPRPARVVSLLPAVLTLYSLDENLQTVAQGSGFAIGADGLAVTNWHVIRDATSAITVRTNEGGQFSLAEIAAFDESADLVLFRFRGQAQGVTTPPHGFPCLTLGSSLDLEPGT